MSYGVSSRADASLVGALRVETAGEQTTGTVASTSSRRYGTESKRERDACEPLELVDCIDYSQIIRMRLFLADRAALCASLRRNTSRGCMFLASLGRR
jgi:hypothetical protein